MPDQISTLSNVVIHSPRTYFWVRWVDGKHKVGTGTLGDLARDEHAEDTPYKVETAGVDENGNLYTHPVTITEDESNERFTTFMASGVGVTPELVRIPR